MGILYLGPSDSPSSPANEEIAVSAPLAQAEAPIVVYQEIIKEVPVEVIKEIIVEKEIQVPVYIEVPVEIITQVPFETIKEVFVDRVVEVEKFVEVEKSVPVFIDRIVVREVIPQAFKIVFFVESALLCILLLSKCI